MMDLKVDFKTDGFLFNVNEKEVFHEYSPFFPYDIIEIIAPVVLENHQNLWYTWGNRAINNYPWVDTSSTDSTSDTSGTSLRDNNMDLYTILVKELTPLFIKKSFKYWNYEPFVDKIIELFNRHKSIFSNKFVDTEPRFFHGLYNIYDIFPDVAEIGLSSPFTFFLSLMDKDKEKEYFLDDLIKFSETKVVYICEKIFNIIFGTSCTPTPHPIFGYIKEHGIDKIKEKKTENFFGIYSNIVKNIPKSVDKFPLHESCHIPTLTVYPETEFQWALVNHYMKSINRQTAFNDTFFPKLPLDIKSTELTSMMLPYIQASEKAVEIYKNFREREGEANNICNWVVYSDNSYKDKYELTRMLQYIKDGKEIYERYQGRTVEKEGRLLKMAEVKGSFLKQLKNSIYNHNLEEKMSIDEKLQLLLDEKTEPDMYIDMKLSEVLEDHRIKTKKEMIILGKELGHCLGSKIDSKDLFFRFETVCVQINIENTLVVQCSDRKNKTTDKSNVFELFLCDEFAKIGIKLTSNKYDREEIRDDVMELHGVDINNFEDNGDENNNIQIYNDNQNITYTNNATIPNVILKTEAVNIKVFDDSNKIDDIKHYRTYHLLSDTSCEMISANYNLG